MSRLLAQQLRLFIVRCFSLAPFPSSHELSGVEHTLQRLLRSLRLSARGRAISFRHIGKSVFVVEPNLYTKGFEGIFEVRAG
jgi:hypothetical protein